MDSHGLVLSRGAHWYITPAECRVFGVYAAYSDSQRAWSCGREGPFVPSSAGVALHHVLELARLLGTLALVVITPEAAVRLIADADPRYRLDRFLAQPGTVETQDTIEVVLPSGPKLRITRLFMTMPSSFVAYNSAGNELAHYRP